MIAPKTVTRKPERSVMIDCAIAFDLNMITVTAAPRGNYCYYSGRLVLHAVLVDHDGCYKISREGGS